MQDLKSFGSHAVVEPSETRRVFVPARTRVCRSVENLKQSLSSTPLAQQCVNCRTLPSYLIVLVFLWTIQAEPSVDLLFGNRHRQRNGLDRSIKRNEPSTKSILSFFHRATQFLNDLNAVAKCSCQLKRVGCSLTERGRWELASQARLLCVKAAHSYRRPVLRHHRLKAGIRGREAGRLGPHAQACRHTPVWIAMHPSGSGRHQNAYMAPT